MRAVLFLIALFAPLPVWAATYAPSEAAAHVGESATVQGTISQTHVDDKSGAGFLNMGGRHPNQAFHGYIPGRAMGRFGNLGRYEGKTVGITGTIRDFHGKPEIVVSDPGQITSR